MTEQVKASRKLRELIATAAPVVAPGAYDGLSARLVEQAGFPAVYITGGGMARSMGIPDLGLMSLTEIVGRLASIVDAVDIPRSEEHTSELQSLMLISYAVFCFKKKKNP